jgi:hypothetical protein
VQPRQLAPIALTKSICIYMHTACQTCIVYIQMLTMKLDSECAIVCTLIPQIVLLSGFPAPFISRNCEYDLSGWLRHPVLSQLARQGLFMI